MSLIQDALKRKSEETGNRESPPPVSPELSISDQKKPKTPKVFFILLSVTLILVLLAGTAAIALHLIRSSRPVPPPETVAQAPEPSPAEPEPLTTEPVQTPVEKPRPQQPPAVEEKPEPVLEKTAKTKWPELNLTGTAASGNQSIAMLNGRMLSAGDQIDEVRIIRVDVANERVVVEFNGKQRTLYVE